MNQRPRIAFVTNRDPHTPASSGVHYAFQALSSLADIRPVVIRPNATRRLLARAGFPQDPISIATMQQARRTTQRALASIHQRADAVLGMFASRLIDPEPLRVPYLHVTDATFRALQGYYYSAPDPTPGRASLIEQYEQQALTHAQRLLVPSGWAARSARNDYNVPEDRIRIVPFGANLPPDSGVHDEGRDRGSHFHLLSIGMQWHRKGMDTLVEAAALLTDLPLTLHLVGCDAPPDTRLPPNVTLHGYLTRSNPAQNTLFDKLWHQASLFLLASRAECFGHVLAEAMHHSIPVLATDTGGLPEVVPHTSDLIPLDATPTQWAARIRERLSDPAALAASARQAHQRAVTVLDWKVWARRVVDEAVTLLA